MRGGQAYGKMCSIKLRKWVNTPSSLPKKLRLNNISFFGRVVVVVVVGIVVVVAVVVVAVVVVVVVVVAGLFLSYLW